MDYFLYTSLNFGEPANERKPRATSSREIKIFDSIFYLDSLRVVDLTAIDCLLFFGGKRERGRGAAPFSNKRVQPFIRKFYF